MSVFKDLIVLECASVLAGPAAGAMFAELGATVIKLEPLQGDVTRSWKLPNESLQTTVSAYFSCVNWGKKSISLDLQHERGRKLAQQVASQADIVIANYKPGAAEKLGMDALTLRTLQPRLIYAHLTGYGADDKRTGYDALIQAESGFLSLNAHPGALPTKMPVALMDILAAHQLKEAILVALLERMHTGIGDYLEVSLLQSAVASLANQASNYLITGHEPRAMGLEHPNIVPYGSLYKTVDQCEVMLAIGSDAQFAKLVKLLGQPDLSANPLYADNQQRVKHRESLHLILKELIARQTCSLFLEQCWQAGLPVGEVNSVSEALELPGVQDLRLKAEKIEGIRTSVFHSQALPWEQMTPPPELAKNSQEILMKFAELSLDEYFALKEARIVG